MPHESGGAKEANGFHVDVTDAVQGLVANTLTQLTELWRTFGLSDDEQQQQHKVLVATVEKACQTRVTVWRDEVKHATSRVSELEKEIQAIKAQFQGNESAGWCIESLTELHGLHGRSLRDRLAALEMEFKFLDSVRNSRMAEINRLREHLGRLDEKLGTTSSLPNADDVANLSEDHKTMLRSLVQSKSREVRTRRAALLEAVSECVHLAQELQIEAAYVFSAELDARLKKRDLSVDMIQKIAERTVELRDLKTKREAHLAEMHGEIQRLWRELEVPEKDRERFQTTIHGIGKASLASCEAELGRLQRHHKRFSAITIQVTSLREVITKHWDLLGYSPNAREYFAEMMNTADSDLSYKVFRSHEKEAERLKRHLFGMRILTNYVIKREDIAQARADNAVPDEKLRVRIDRDLPRYTAILNERIEKWQKETGLVFCWNGEAYLEHMRTADREYEQENKKARQPQQTEQQAPERRSPGRLNNNRRLQGRHSLEEREAPLPSSIEAQLHRRRSDPQRPHQHGWRNFLRDAASTFSRRQRPTS